MSFLADAVGAISSGASGGILGIIGSGVGMIGKVAEQRNELKLKKMDQDHELALLDREIEQEGARREHDLSMMLETNDANRYIATVEHDKSITGTSQWMADLRASVRPVSFYVLLLASLVIFIVVAFMDAPTTEMMALAQQIYFMTGTVLSWYFSARFAEKKIPSA